MSKRSALKVFNAPSASLLPQLGHPHTQLEKEKWDVHQEVPSWDPECCSCDCGEIERLSSSECQSPLTLREDLVIRRGWCPSCSSVHQYWEQQEGHFLKSKQVVEKSGSGAWSWWIWLKKLFRGGLLCWTERTMPQKRFSRHKTLHNHPLIPAFFLKTSFRETKKNLNHIIINN